eukprot:1135789-Lingulodinium_polyedra.AAC.1
MTVGIISQFGIKAWAPSLLLPLKWSLSLLPQAVLLKGMSLPPRGGAKQRLQRSLGARSGSPASLQ